ncbi:MAG: IscS subfamily cysteine desulfurase [Pelagibacterales bacterium]|nr:IscS subfamily cysteine desulfurase [Pelagibacterales bacterium]
MLYLDNNSTTKIDEEVLNEMLPYLNYSYGNSASRTHKFGWDANDAVKKARERVANLINAKPDEITFNSGSTEGINFLIKGVFEEYLEKGNHIITVKTEHKAVLDVCEFLSNKGGEITYLNVNKDGLIDINELKNAISDKTILISVMYANNETGVIQDIKDIGKIARENNILFMTDATQAVGKIKVDVIEDNIDLLTISAHKLHGPKGVGAVFIKRRFPKIKITPLLHGGGHEKGYRSGTINVAGVVGLGKASEIAQKLGEYKSVLKLRNQLEKELSEIEGISLNGDLNKRLPNTINVCISGVDAEAIIIKIRDEFAIASGSACTSAEVLPSHVIMAMYENEEKAYSSIRISLGKNITTKEIQRFSKILKKKIISIKNII